MRRARRQGRDAFMLLVGFGLVTGCAIGAGYLLFLGGHAMVRLAGLG
jgi:hypothetical protein